MKRAAWLGLLLVVFFAAPPAKAQSGATGGSLGKSSKSLSGSAPMAAPAAPSRTSAPRDPCKKVPGRWRWYNNVVVMLHTDGRAQASNGDSGNWTCNAGNVRVNWSIAFDNVSPTADGRRLVGTNMVGFPISNVRE